MFSRDDIEAVLYGAATADALGAPYEFLSPQEIEARGIIEMEGGHSGITYIEPGAWTDDTELSLLLAETLALGLPLRDNLLAKRYIAWAESSPPDIGITTRAALVGSSGATEARDKAAAFHKMRGRSAGNGVIMRAAPLALTHLEDSDLQEVLVQDASITHFAPEAWQAAYIYLLAIRSLLIDGEFSAEDIVIDEFSSEVQEAVENHHSEEYVMVEVERGGTSWSTLAVALHSLQFGDYSDGVRWAISLGYDTDTNATCTGALLAARDGLSKIPSRWTEVLLHRERIDAAVDGLASLNS